LLVDIESWQFHQSTFFKWIRFINTKGTICMGTAAMQGQVWGVRARDWAEAQEGQFTPVFNDVLQRASAGPGTSVLDIGCGSGLFTQLAAQRGAHVSGLDASEPFLTIARERTPLGDFRTGEMEELPYPDHGFDLVTGFNSFQFAADPVRALQEARRVLKPGGHLAISILGNPKENESTAYFSAIGSLLPPPPPGKPGPFALSMNGALEALVTQAGMNPGKVEIVDCPWQYPDEQTLLRALLSTGPSIMAMQNNGEAAVRDVILNALAPFRTDTGGYQIGNNGRTMMIRI
jgi:SAM-dependent methyltransferase